MSQPASEVPLAVQEGMQEAELQILSLPLLGPLLLLCPMWAAVIREEMEAVGQLLAMLAALGILTPGREQEEASSPVGHTLALSRAHVDGHQQQLCGAWGWQPCQLGRRGGCDFRCAEGFE